VDLGVGTISELRNAWQAQRTVDHERGDEYGL
jgi:hypothetical protein